MSNSLAVQRYQINARLLEPLHLNDYSGSLLRGAFGRALKKTICVLDPRSECKSCLFYRQCGYPKLFEPQPRQSGLQHLSEMPPPYVIEPPEMGRQNLPVGELFCFDMVLLGPAIAELPYLIMAWQQALARGLGKQHARVQLETIVFEPGQSVEQVIYTNRADATLTTPAPFVWSIPETLPEQITIELLSPLRIQQKGKILQQLTARDFLMALVRRFYLLCECYSPDYQAPDFTQLARAAETIQIESQLSTYSWSRYSSRQKRAMSFEGVQGQLTLQGDLTPFIRYLIGGQWWHLGNKTSFGMGRYRLV